MLPFIRKNLAPNRLAVYFVALAALASGVVTVLGDLDFQSTAGLLGSVGVLAAVVAKWLAGWQQYEKALYQAQLLEREQQALAEQQEAAMQRGRPGSGPSVRLPR